MILNNENASLGIELNCVVKRERLDKRQKDENIWQHEKMVFERNFVCDLVTTSWKLGSRAASRQEVRWRIRRPASSGNTITTMIKKCQCF